MNLQQSWITKQESQITDHKNCLCWSSHYSYLLLKKKKRISPNHCWHRCYSSDQFYIGWPYWDFLKWLLIPETFWREFPKGSINFINCIGIENQLFGVWRPHKHPGPSFVNGGGILLSELFRDTIGPPLTTVTATTDMMGLGQAFMLIFIPQSQIQQQQNAADYFLKLGWNQFWICKFEMDLIPSSLYSTFPVWFPFLLGQCTFTGCTI